MTMSVSQPTLAEGGLISKWNFVQQGSLLLFTAPTINAMPYGAFGSSMCIGTC